MPRGEGRDGGNRGGRDQFNWDDVKNDPKFRENYIGHSLHASKGRWQKGKDLTWYARGKVDTSTAEVLKEEKRRAKEMEEDMMRARLGLAPIKRAPKGVLLDEHEAKELLQRGRGNDGEPSAAGSGEVMGGLGSFAAPRHGGSDAGPIKSRIIPEDRLEGTAGTSEPQLGGEWARVDPQHDRSLRAPNATEDGKEGLVSTDSEDRETSKRLQKKEKKEKRKSKDKKVTTLELPS